MQTIHPIQMEEAAGSTRRLLQAITVERGGLDNMIQTMAHSPTALEGYQRFGRALLNGSLSPELRALIALTVAQCNRCDYSLATHAERAGRLGLTLDEIRAARDARSTDEKRASALRFARDLIDRQGDCSTVELRQSGYSDGEIVEIVAAVALNVFENYFNNVAQTELEATIGEAKAQAA